MIPKKRIGNDLRFVWSILNDGQPYFLEDKNLTLLVRDTIGPVTVSDVVYSENTVAFTFYGTQMRTIDIVGCIELVPHSYMEEPGDNGSHITMETINLESSVIIGIPGPPGKSAYESAREGGYTGTLQEFYHLLGNIDKMHVVLPQDEYDALEVKDPELIYMTYEVEE